MNTVELHWLEHLWDYENVFETGVVRASEGLLMSQVRRHNRDILSIFFNMKVYCVFSLESPHRLFFSILKRKKIMNYPTSATMEFVPRDLRMISKHQW